MSPMAWVRSPGGWVCPIVRPGRFAARNCPMHRAAYETANSLNMGLLAGVNFMLHAAGWLEGGAGIEL